MALFLYNCLLWLLFPVLFLHYLRGRLAYKKYTRPVSERLGYFRIQLSPSTKQRILVHAVSAGETVAAQPLVEEIRKRFPEAELVFSNVTETGHDRAKQLINADHFVFFPLDYRSSVQRFLNQIKPTQVFILETELWPNFLKECQNRAIPIAFVNGRISKRSFERYSLTRTLWKDLLKTPRFFMQSEEDLDRIKSLGATMVEVSGNLKVDQLDQNLHNSVRKEIYKTFENFERPLVLFGSTHREETAEILRLISKWKIQNLNAAFLIAPRHLHFLEEYLKLARELGLQTVRKTTFRTSQEFDCMFVDTFGELANLYEICTIAVIGGSFEDIGGHSILEPALFERPILYGPHMENGKDISRLFEKNGASWKAQDYEDLGRKIELLLQNPPLRQELGQNAGRSVRSIMGVTQSILDRLSDTALIPDYSNNPE
ncbi:hypothetical protein HOF92_05235 [bacterium]|jgi:3-deoxy-D-manno-octulosonic-acid transferase|nr:hypothetical protein [bacterium]